MAVQYIARRQLIHNVSFLNSVGYLAAQIQLALHMSPVLLVFGTDIFKNIAVRDKSQSGFKSKRTRVVFWVIKGDLQIHVPEIAAAISLSDTHRFAARMAYKVEPAVFFKASRFDDQCVAFPLSNR